MIYIRRNMQLMPQDPKDRSCISDRICKWVWCKDNAICTCGAGVEHLRTIETPRGRLIEKFTQDIIARESKACYLYEEIEIEREPKVG